MAFTIEKILRVFDEENAVYLEIRQNPDFPEDGIEVHTNNNKDNEEWYGKISLPINSKEHAKALANAILEMAEMIK